MKNQTHLILGFTGGIGRAVAHALSKRDISIKVLVRDRKKAEKYANGLKNLHIVEGDAANPGDLKKTFEEADIVHYCINMPYHQWEAKALRLLKNCVDAAVGHKIKLVFPGNVYVYGHARYNPVDEKHPHAAHTKKGQIRMEMEEMLALARKDEGLDYTIIRMPDFYGPYVINGFSEQLFINAIKGKILRWVGNLDVELEMIYIEDAGESMVMAALNDQSNGEVFNVPGQGITSSRKFLQEIVDASGVRSKFGTVNSDLFFKIFGLFNPVVKELVEMLYLKREKLILSGQKFNNVIGPIPSTDYSTGIAKTLAWAKEHYSLK
ncbi:MAG: NAD-dependent epimerase/dehydratase family protein [Cytophagales bacterium]|nr:NAD-dependent epimerase/dehydratase family protein [Cytophagales bacterium]